MVHTGHTPASFLGMEYTYCLQRETSARKKIALLAIELYHAEVSPEHREIQFQHLEHAADPEKAIIANVRKVHDLFSDSRTVRLPFSFSHFIARAIDQLYARGCVEQIQQIIAGPKTYATGSTAALLASTQSFNKESAEVVAEFLQLASKGFENLTKSDRERLTKEAMDSIRAAEGIISTLATGQGNVQPIVKAKH